ncbi:MAG: MlaA family lipoprotein [Candidatus Rokuibacteriota bacterium]
MRVSFTGSSRGLIASVLGVALALVVSGCGTLSGTVRPQSALLADRPLEGRVVADPTEPVAPSPPVVDAASPEPGAHAITAHSAPVPEATTVATEPLTPAEPAASADDAVMAQVRAPEPLAEPMDAAEYDPWEPFNEKMFEFNRNLDRYVLKPVAKAYNVVMPEPFQVMISNGFDNINFVPRLVNSALQGKWGGAGRELSRFLINSTAGIGGLFDPAKDYWGIPKSREDFGQTLGVWGSGPGPYLVLPFMEPLTVRDGIGKLVDSFMDPLSYYLPLFWDRLGMKVGDVVNERSLNLDLYQGFEESVIDMYSAVRHGYLQRRERLIRE